VSRHFERETTWMDDAAASIATAKGEEGGARAEATRERSSFRDADSAMRVSLIKICRRRCGARARPAKMPADTTARQNG
jgi:hypothetical protein